MYAKNRTIFILCLSVFIVLLTIHSSNGKKSINKLDDNFYDNYNQQPTTNRKGHHHHRQRHSKHGM